MVDMRVDQAAEGFGAPRPLSDWRPPSINLIFSLGTARVARDAPLRVRASLILYFA
jgi:hypothetical protein